MPSSRWIGAALIVVPLWLVPQPLAAHPGGLNSEGCHNNRKTGDYHCHGSGRPAAPPPRPAIARQPLRALGSDVYFSSCAEARAAGAAPLRRGDPGYRAGLDRDDDGVACE